MLRATWQQEAPHTHINPTICKNSLNSRPANPLNSTLPFVSKFFERIKQRHREYLQETSKRKNLVPTPLFLKLPVARRIQSPLFRSRFPDWCFDHVGCILWSQAKIFSLVINVAIDHSYHL
ncbi:hypothetical protein AAHA92_06373 [Salvia divinorum]|uniref:Uncharacterized protein n=1 Tax=Salvia divinorum TaxID=28513 RepID=A0ABD1I5E8_SALDI